MWAGTAFSGGLTSCLGPEHAVLTASRAALVLRVGEVRAGARTGAGGTCSDLSATCPSLCPGPLSLGGLGGRGPLRQ